MSTEPTISLDAFRNAMKVLLEEVFDTPQRYVFDPGEQLLPTLGEITASEASERVSTRTSTLAAQVNHLCVYLEAVTKGPDEKVDWAASWTDVTTVNDEEWAGLIERVQRDLTEIRAFVDRFEGWDQAYIGGGIALLVHTGYHLGEIRTGIGVIRDRRA